MTYRHRELDSSSSHENVLDTLEELKEVYSRNSYPPALVNSKIKYSYLTVKNSSPQIKYFICELTRKMANIIPEFRVNVTYRSGKVGKLFSFLEKPVTDTYEKSNVVYDLL